MKSAVLFLVVGVMSMVCMTHAAVISHYTMEETSGAIVDQVGGETADPVDGGHLYGVSSPFGSGVGLNANGSWQLDLAESAELGNLVNNITVAAWINLDSQLAASKTGLNAHNNRIIGDDSDWDGDTWSFGIQSGNLLFTKNGVVDALSGVAVPTDQWVHVAAVVSSTAGIDFYLNGSWAANVGNTADMFVSNTHPSWWSGTELDDVFAIGRSYSIAQEQWFAGSIDEVLVYDEVLDAALDIEQLPA